MRFIESPAVESVRLSSEPRDGRVRVYGTRIVWELRDRVVFAGGTWGCHKRRSD